MPLLMRALILPFAFALLAAPSLAEGAGPPKVEASIGALERALQEHDFSVLEGSLAPDFGYAGHQGALARTIMEQVVQGYPAGLDRVTILGVREEPDGTRTVRVAFDAPAGSEEHGIRLAADGRILQAEVARIRLASHGGPAAGERAGEASWSVALADPVVEVPFELRDTFSVPLVEVRIGDRGPYLFAVDTAAACTVLLRRSLVQQLDLERVGEVAVADASGRPSRGAETVRLPELRAGGLVARELLAVSHVPSAAHAASIPADVHGILGRVLFESLLLTLDYPGRRLLLSDARLQPGPSVVSFELVQDVMQLRVGIAGQSIPVVLDSGHRGTVTLPRSWADRLPLASPLADAGRAATVNVTYIRQTAPLAGSILIADERVESPPLFFADEHTPKLLGGGLLREFLVTIDQRSRLLRFERSGAAPETDTNPL
jgi:hypothetical protein